jgi:DNA-binding response OmpR family regulator
MSKKILLIDHDGGFAKPLVAALLGRGFSVRHASDGAEGLDLAHAERPDAIVLAAELPRTSGYAVCNRIKRDPALREIPLLLTSAAASAETFDQHRKLQTRAEDYLSKPFAADVLVQRLGALVGSIDVPPVDGDLAGIGDVRVESTLAALQDAAAGSDPERDQDLVAIDAAFQVLAAVSAEPAANAMISPANDAPAAPAANDAAALAAAALEARVADAERDLAAAVRRAGELEALLGQYEQRLRKAYQQLKTDEELREKTRKALAIALQLLDGKPPAPSA